MQIKPKIVANFSFGLNTYDPVTTLKPGSFSACENVTLFSKGFGSRMGHTLHYDSGIATPIHSEFQFTKLSTGVKHMIHGQGTKVYSDGIEIDTGRSGEALSFAVLNDLLHYTDGTNNIRVWDGAAAVADLGGGPPVALAIKEYKACLFCIGVVGGKNVLQWSSVDTPTDWPVANFVVLNDNDPQGLVGMEPYFNQLAVFKKTKAYLLDGLPLLSNTMLLPTNVGCIGRNTIATTPKGPVWMWHDGAYALIDGDAVKISTQVDSYFQDSNKTRHKYASAGYFRNAVNIAFASGSAAAEDTLLQYDTIRGGWTLWPGYNVSSMCNAYDSDSIEIQLHGTSGGKMMRAFSGTDDDGTGYRASATIAPFLFPQEVTLMELVIYAEIFSSHGIDFTYQLDSGEYSSPAINIPNPDITGAIYDLSLFDSSYYAANRVVRAATRIGGQCRQVEFSFLTPGPNMPWKIHRVEVNALPGAR